MPSEPGGDSVATAETPRRRYEQRVRALRSEFRNLREQWADAQARRFEDQEWSEVAHHLQAGSRALKDAEQLMKDMRQKLEEHQRRH